MPELPEVETVRRGLAPTLVGARFAKVETRRGDLRTPFPPRFAERLKGRRVEALTRRAKYLVATLDGGETLVMHLGMSGSFRVERGEVLVTPPFHHERPKLAAHDHVVFELDNGARVVFNDPRRFGAMDLVKSEGIDSAAALRRSRRRAAVAGVRRRAVSPPPSPARARRSRPRCSTRSASRASATSMSSRRCFARGISPLRPAAILADAKGKPTAAARKLAPAIRDVLEEAVAAGGSTLRDHRQPDGELGYFQHSFAVYDREGAACPHKGCRGHDRSASCRARARRSIAGPARNRRCAPPVRPGRTEDFFRADLYLAS